MSKKPAQAVDNRETKSQPSHPFMARPRQLYELAEDIALLILGNSNAAVPYFDVQQRTVVAAADYDASLVGVANRVRDQIEHDALEQDRIAFDPCTAAHHSEPQPFLACGIGERGLHPPEQLARGNYRGAGLQHFGIELRHVEERVEEIVHCTDSSVDPPDKSLAFSRTLFGPQLRHEQIERVERLPEVMAGCRNETGLVLVCECQLMGSLLNLSLERRIRVLQLLGHIVELIGERRELIARRD